MEQVDLPIPVSEQPVVPAIAEEVTQPIVEETRPAVPVANAEPIPVESPIPLAEEVIAPKEVDTVKFVASSGSRQIFETGLLFFCAIFFLRAMAVEPFGVPTGSMAPTLTGNHRSAHCPRCNYLIRVGDPSIPQSHVSVNCPNCGQTGIDLDHALEIPGDRLLVDKNVFSLRRPRRWEAAVFRCPSDLTKPYVKRVVALPGESIQVADGDIYINGKISRKSLEEVREVRIPIFDINFPPQPGGWQHDWLAEPSPMIQDAAHVAPWLMIDGKELRANGTAFAGRTVWAIYRHCLWDEKLGEDRERVIRDGFAYNGLQIEEQLVPVHDFSIEFELEVLAGDGAICCLVRDGQDEVLAQYPVGSQTREAVLKPKDGGRVRAIQQKAMTAGKKYRIEMSFCDRRVYFAVDGCEIFAPYDLPSASARADVVSPFALGFEGISVIVRNLRIYRDIYYRSSGPNGVEQPYRLGADEYFMMGDNSSNSNDSRSWEIPGVPERNFLGKPFLLHQPSRDPGDFEGRIQLWLRSIDWSRIRWLR